mgnify:CR=1 FL=1
MVEKLERYVRILVLADIHANLDALEAVLTAAGDVDEVWSLGDIVGYGPQPCECIERVRALASISITGNHDWASIGRLPLDDFNPTARFSSYWTTMQLGLDHIQYLESLPNRVIDRDWTIVHGSPRHPIWEYVTSPRIAAQNFPLFDTPLCFIGHTHVQISMREEESPAAIKPCRPDDGEVLDLSAGRFLINPGSVGQPRDGDPRAAFAIFEPDARRITFRRVPYPIESTQERMREAGLPESLAARLALGV